MMVLMPVNWLNKRNQHRNHQRLSKGWIQHVSAFFGDCGMDGKDFGLRGIPALDAGEDVFGFGLATLLHQPTRAFRNKEQR